MSPNRSDLKIKLSWLKLAAIVRFDRVPYGSLHLRTVHCTYDVRRCLRTPTGPVPLTVLDLTRVRSFQLKQELENSTAMNAGHIRVVGERSKRSDLAERTQFGSGSGVWQNELNNSDQFNTTSPQCCPSFVVNGAQASCRFSPGQRQR